MPEEMINHELGNLAALSQRGREGWEFRAVIPGPAVAKEDVLVNRYRVVIDPALKVHLMVCAATAKIGPGSDYTADILMSEDDGATWNSVFDGAPMTIPGGSFKNDQDNFVIEELFNDNLLRVDVLGGDPEGIELVLRGRYEINLEA